MRVFLLCLLAVVLCVSASPHRRGGERERERPHRRGQHRRDRPQHHRHHNDSLPLKMEYLAELLEEVELPSTCDEDIETCVTEAAEGECGRGTRPKSPDASACEADDEEVKAALEKLEEANANFQSAVAECLTGEGEEEERLWRREREVEEEGRRSNRRECRNAKRRARQCKAKVLACPLIAQCVGAGEEPEEEGAAEWWRKAGELREERKQALQDFKKQLRSCLRSL